MGEILFRCFHTPQLVTSSVARPIPSPQPRAIWLPLRSSGSPLSLSSSPSSSLEPGALVDEGLSAAVEDPPYVFVGETAPLVVGPIICSDFVLASQLGPRGGEEEHEQVQPTSGRKRTYGCHHRLRGQLNVDNTRVVPAKPATVVARLAALRSFRRRAAASIRRAHRNV